MSLDKENIIVTGGAGFIGSHTVVELIEAGFNPIVIDDFRNSEVFVLDRIQEITGHKVTYYDFDCSDKTKMQVVIEKHRPTGLVHFAADKAVGESVANPLKYYHNNVGSLVAVLDVCVKNHINHIVFSSSCTVYGDPKVVPVTEFTPHGVTTSPYGFSKQICEKMCEDVANANAEIHITLLRYFNPVGAHPTSLIGELPIGVPNNLVPYITQAAAELRPPLTVFGQDYATPDGTCVRDYIHVSDLGDAHVKALQKSKSTATQLSIYNVGTGVGRSIMDVINTFEKVNNISLKYSIGERRSGDIDIVFADNTKIVNDLGWQPKYILEDALKHAWQWQLKLKDQ